MSEEKLSCEQQCASCPNRSVLSQLVAKLAMKPESVEGCDGYALVSRGQTVSATVQRGEPAPEGDWNCISGLVTDKKGHRWVTYISGEEQDINTARYIAAMTLERGENGDESETVS